MTPDERRPGRGLLVEFLEWIGLLGLIYGPLDRRLSLRGALEQSLKRPVANLPVWACFGGIALFLFAIQVVTGLLLMLSYVPSASEAQASIGFLSGRVPFGWLARNIHHWSANGMLLALAVHTLRVFFTGAYILKALKLTLHGPLAERWKSLTDLGVRELIVVSPLMALSLWIGIWPAGIMNLFNLTVAALF